VLLNACDQPKAKYHWRVTRIDKFNGVYGKLADEAYPAEEFIGHLEEFPELLAASVQDFQNLL